MPCAPVALLQRTTVAPGLSSIGMNAEHHSRTRSFFDRAAREFASDAKCIRNIPPRNRASCLVKHPALFLQVDAGGRVKLQLGVGAPASAEAEVEELRAELDRMEHGGEDAEDAHMYARSCPPALQMGRPQQIAAAPPHEACIRAEWTTGGTNDTARCETAQKCLVLTCIDPPGLPPRLCQHNQLGGQADILLCARTSAAADENLYNCWSLCLIHIMGLQGAGHPSACCRAAEH